jgi:hypothetical protein
MKTDQRGFTLLELLFGATASMIMLVPSVALISRAIAWDQEARSQIAVNRHARVIFETFLNGARGTSNGNDGTKNLYGLDGKKGKPTSAYRNGYRFSYSSNGLTVIPDEFAALSVVCTGTATPLPDCTSSTTKTVRGWVGKDASLETSKRVIASRTFEIEMTVTDPYEVQRLKNAAASTVYRTVATRIRDENDP